jgi:hypothetical protein
VVLEAAARSVQVVAWILDCRPVFSKTQGVRIVP